MSTIDQQFIEFVVKSLVSKPDEVKVERRIDEKGVLLELTVDPEDLGRVIGKRGATAQSIRTLLRALGTKNDARYNLKIVDNGEPRPPREDRREVEQSSSQPEEPEQAQPEEERPAQSHHDEGEPAGEYGSFADDSETDVQPEKKEDKLSQTRRELADLDDLDV